MVVFHGVLGESPSFLEVLPSGSRLSLPGWYLVARCVAQAVGNGLCSRSPDKGVCDYDLPYCNPDDLSWDAQDCAIQAAKDAFAGLPAAVEVRNEARVHVWYERNFGVPCPPYSSTEAAIDPFLSTVSCLGVWLGADGSGRIHAPCRRALRPL